MAVVQSVAEVQEEDVGRVGQEHQQHVLQPRPQVVVVSVDGLQVRVLAQTHAHSAQLIALSRVLWEEEKYV